MTKQRNKNSTSLRGTKAKQIAPKVAAEKFVTNLNLSSSSPSQHPRASHEGTPLEKKNKAQQHTRCTYESRSEREKRGRRSARVTSRLHDSCSRTAGSSPAATSRYQKPSHRKPRKNIATALCMHCLAATNADVTHTTNETREGKTRSRERKVFRALSLFVSMYGFVVARAIKERGRVEKQQKYVDATAQTMAAKPVGSSYTKVFPERASASARALSCAR